MDECKPLHGGFPAPLLLTSVQFGMQYVIACLVLTHVCPGLKPRKAIPWGLYFTHVAPVVRPGPTAPLIHAYDTP